MNKDTQNPMSINHPTCPDVIDPERHVIILAFCDASFVNMPWVSSNTDAKTATESAKEVTSNKRAQCLLNAGAMP